MSKTMNYLSTFIISTFMDIRRIETQSIFISLSLTFFNLTLFILTHYYLCFLIMLMTFFYYCVFFILSWINFTKTFRKNETKLLEYRKSLIEAIQSLFNPKFIKANKSLSFLMFFGIIGMFSSYPVIYERSTLAVIVSSLSVFLLDGFIFIGLSKAFKEQEKFKYLTNSVFSDNQ